MGSKIRASEISGGTKWFNGEPLSIKELKGKVVLVDFWTYSCVNCLRTLPFIKEWYNRYKDKGLQIIGVHTPEFGFEKEEQNVERFLSKADINYPVILDNNHEIWNRFANRYWPSKYLIDANGYIRYTHYGEGAYAETERLIQQLLKEKDPSLDPGPISEMAESEEIGKVCYPVTSETYTGFARGLPGNKKRSFDNVFDYQDAEKHQEDRFYLQGQFVIKPAYVRHCRRTDNLADYLLLKYKSFEVNAVMKASLEENLAVYLELDGRPIDAAIKGADVEYDERGRSLVLVTEPKLYNLIQNSDINPHELIMRCDSDQWEIYAFTFGACTKQLAA